MNTATKGNSLTPKQEAFCRHYAVEGMTQRQAYIAAYGKSNKSDKTIDEAASRLIKHSKVLARLKEFKTALADKVIWDKADMINDLKRIAEECRDAPIKVLNKGKVSLESIDSKARSVAVQAIRTASEILGYKAPEKVNLGSDSITGIRINFVDKSGQRTGKEKDPKIIGEYTPPIDTEG